MRTSLAWGRAPSSALRAACSDRGVAVEGEHHAVGEAEQLLHMFGVQAVQRGHGVRKTQLRQRHHVHIAFGYQHRNRLRAAPGEPRTGHTVRAPWEHGFSGEFRYSGLLVAQHPAEN